MNKFFFIFLILVSSSASANNSEFPNTDEAYFVCFRSSFNSQAQEDIYIKRLDNNTFKGIKLKRESGFLGFGEKEYFSDVMDIEFKPTQDNDIGSFRGQSPEGDLIHIFVSISNYSGTPSGEVYADFNGRVPLMGELICHVESEKQIMNHNYSSKNNVQFLHELIKL